MKKRFTIFMTVLFALTLITRTAEVMGQNTSNFTLSSASSVTQDGITASFAKGSGSNDPTWYAAGLRLYASNTVTISSANDITGIAFDWEKQGNKAFASVTANTGSYTHPTTTGTGTWSGSANEVVFTLGTSGQLQLNTFSVTTGGSTPTTYTVTFDANGGTFVANTDFANTTNTVTAGTYTLPSATPPTGYTFEAWNIGQYQYQANASYTVSGNADFVASYTQNGGGGSQTLTFDFEDESAHRTSGNNSYTGTNTYSENGATITLTYADAVTSGTPIDGSANVLGRVAKNTTNSPVVLIGPIDITGWTISKIEYKTKGVSAMSQLFESSLDNSTWTTQNNLSSMPTTTETETVDNLSITGTNLYLRWTVSVSSSTGSNRDFQLDDIVITYTDASTAAATTTTISVPSGFNTDLHNGTTAGTLTATVTSEGSPVSGATVTWSSSETSVATVGSDGAVTLVAVGTTTITAAYAGVEDVYKPSSDTYELTVIDSYAPGTQNNPYTVAQAIANTPSSGDVYIQGIVSSFYNTSIVGDGTNYRYYVSDDGTTTTQLLVYKGKGLNQETFSNVNDLLVGDEVVICGSLVTYQSAPEVASGNYLYSWNRPAVEVEAPTFSPAAGTYTTTQSVTISCATTGADIYYTTDGTTPDANSILYTSAISVSTTTTIKAIAYYAGANSTVATATYHFCSPTDPYTVTEALAFDEYPANEIYVEGIVSTAPTQNPTSNGELTYYISVDGNATNQLEVYKGKGLNQAGFEDKTDIQVGDIVTVYGNVVIYNSTKEFAQGNYLVYFERPTPPTQEYTLSVGNPANITFTVNYGEEVLTNGESANDVENGTAVTFVMNIAEGYILNELTVLDSDSQPVTVTETSGVYSFTMPTSNVTINASAVVAPAITTYTLATTVESGKNYIIVGQANGDYYAMGNDKGNNRYAYEITLDGTTASAIIASGNNVHEFTITNLATPGFYSICDATESGYLYAASSSNNYLKTEATLDENHNGDWEISINSETGVASVVASNSSYSRNVMQFNNGSILFACYSSASQHPVYLYVKDEPTTSVTYYYSVNGTLSEAHTCAVGSTKTLETGTDLYSNFTFAGWTTDPNDVSQHLTEYTFQDANPVTFYEIYGHITPGTINSSAKGYDVYSQVTNVGDITPMSEYLITSKVTENNSDYPYLFNGLSGQNQYVAGTYAGNGIISDLPAGAAIVKISTHSDANNVIGYSIRISGNTSNNLDKYIGGTSGTSTMNFSNDPILSIISFDEYGNADIVSNTTHLRLNEPDGEFCYYTQPESKNTIQLYKKVTNYYTRVFNETATDNILITGPSIIPSFGILDMGEYNLDYELIPLVSIPYIVIEERGQMVFRKDIIKMRAQKKINAPTGTWGEDDNTGWYAFSSPNGKWSKFSDGCEDFTLPDVGGVRQYDFFAYSEKCGWYNKKDGEYLSRIDEGIGYLYARAESTMLTIGGESFNEDVDLTDLSYTSSRGNLAGLHCIGNPYTHNIYKGVGITGDMQANYYALNEATGAWISTTDVTPIVPMQAILVFVNKTDGTAAIHMTSDNSAPSKKANDDYIKFNVANSKYEDVAYAWFDNGESLNKISHRNSEVPMLYIPQNDGNYSIAYMSDNTEMFNLNFKAMTAGKYTLSVSEKGDFSYLHVYDRLTGEDVDMLLDSYTFIGSPADNEARFIVRLSYNASTTGSETFAFQNGSDVIVNGNGELQVFDLTGRMVMNTTVNGIQAVSMPQGVYVLRMIGENVQTQKIVVR